MSTDAPILVTGATGGLGLNLCGDLKRQGYQVVGLGRDRLKGQKLMAMGVEFVQADITAPFVVPSYAFGGIVHCAARSSPWGRYSDFYQANVVGTERVIDLALERRAPLIHVSTPSVYFNFEDAWQIHEDQILPERMPSFYTLTKKKAEDVVMAARQRGLKAVILRPRGIFGPEDSGLVPRILRIAQTGYFPLIRKGEAWIDVTAVDNVSHAIGLCLKKIQSIEGEIFNITNGEPLQLKQILNMLFSALNCPVRFLDVSFSLMRSLAVVGETCSRMMAYSFEPWITQYTLGLLAYTQTLNIEKARKILGYQPITSVELGIEQYREWQKNARH